MSELGLALTKRFMDGVEHKEFHVVALAMEPVDSPVHELLRARYSTKHRLVLLVAEVGDETEE